MKKLNLTFIFVVALLFSATSMASVINCFDSKGSKRFVLKGYEGNHKAKVLFGTGPMLHEVYVLSNSSSMQMNLVETYSKVYSNFVNPKPTRTVVYGAQRSTDGSFPIAVDGRKYVCKK